MDENDLYASDHQVPVTDILRNWFRVFTTFFGLGMILLGVVFAAELFGVAYAAVAEPERFGVVLDQWAENFGGDEPMIDTGGQGSVSPRLFAFLAMGAAGLVMIILIQTLILTGARIVYWMGTDLEAVKRVLATVFGPSVIQVIKSPKDPSPKQPTRIGKEP
jgi:hypothetical protein